MKSINLPYVILISIVLIMSYYLIFNSHDSVIEEFDDTALRKEISLADSTATYWKNVANMWHSIADKEKYKSDSLKKYKLTIQYYYDKKYTFNTNADVLQLDSVIRANW